MQVSFPRYGHVVPYASAVFVFFAASCATQQNGHPHIHDPYEPLNRTTWEVNRALKLGLMEPVSEIYQSTVPRPVRTSIGNVRHNLGGPLRFTNQALQGRWGDSGRETARFLTNSTLGVGGIFDVATKMDLHGSRGDFYQTFRTWGWQPDTFVVIPFLGPSDNVGVPSRVMDIAAEPSSYIGAIRPVAYATRLHQGSEIIKSSAPIMRTQPDSYDFAQQAWPYMSRISPPDWTVRGAPDLPTLETLGAVGQGPQDPRFLHRGKRHFVRMAQTGRDLPYNAWIRETPAPLVFLTPGVGSHRESGNTLAIAEAFHDMGFSVVTISGIFHPEFMERAAAAPMPGNPIRDRADVLAACTAINADLARKYRKADFTGRIMAGMSLGGFTAMQLAATEERHAPGSVRFDHYLAMHAPVNLQSAYEKIDGFFSAPQQWPVDQREARLDNLFHKAAGIINGQLPEGVPPFDGDETKTLIGYAFRLSLRDSLFSIHARNPQPHVSARASRFRRDEVYRELMTVSFDDYFSQWLKPVENANGTSDQVLFRKISLNSMETTLARSPKVTFIGNSNDFLLNPDDIRWINRTFGHRAYWLPNGGHMGNIGSPAFREILTKVGHRYLEISR